MLLDFLRKMVGGVETGSAHERSVDGPHGQLGSEFSNQLLTEFFSLVHQGAPDNYDHNRFSNDGSDHSGSFNIGFHVAYIKSYFARMDDFYSAYLLFKDEASRELFRQLVLYRMLGHIHVCIKEGASWSTEVAFLENAKKYDAGPSSLNISGLFGSLRHHENIPVPNSDPIKLDCWAANIAYTALKRQYFFERDGVVISPARDDVVMDAGACFGDTAIYFAASVGAGGHVYAFDPLPNHVEVVEFNVRQNKLEDRITVVQSAVGETVVAPSGKKIVVSEAAPGFSMLSGDFGLPVVTLDAFAEMRSLTKLDFIKMDVEGFEMPALIGARRVIEKFRPKLAISLYHKPLDLIEIPMWIAKNFPFYDLYLDHYTIHQEESVLYAVAR